jgi:hypothetical protein
VSGVGTTPLTPDTRNPNFEFRNLHEPEEIMRTYNHPILGEMPEHKRVEIDVDGQILDALEGEPIAAALAANGIRTLRRTLKRNEPRGIFCAVGQCTDCVMTVDGVPNTRTCVTRVKAGMKIKYQGLGEENDGTL